MTALQASLFCRPSCSHLIYPKRPHLSSINFRNSNSSTCISFPSFKSRIWKSRFQRHRSLILRALQPENTNSSSGSEVSRNEWIVDTENLQNGDLFNKFDVEDSRTEPEVSVVEAETARKMIPEVEIMPESGSPLVKEKTDSKFPLMVFLDGVLASASQELEKLASSEWLNWWPFWRQEKWLERLLAEADANPKDAAKQSALLAELNKHRLDSVSQHHNRSSIHDCIFFFRLRKPENSHLVKP